MRIVTWIIGAAAIGALSGGAAATLFPSAQVAQAMQALGVDFSKFTIADLNPIRAAYDVVLAKVQTGMTPEELGLHSSPIVVAAPDPKNWPSVGFTLGPSMRNGWTQTLTAQTREFNNRMGDMRSYAGNPAGWRGPPPR
jgi:hypothetical protein